MPDEKTAHFKIIVRGQIDAHWKHWFDEAAFNGLLSKIRAIGLSILFVERKDDQDDRGN